MADGALICNRTVLILIVLFGTDKAVVSTVEQYTAPNRHKGFKKHKNNL